MNPKTAVERFKLPFVLSLSKPALSEVEGGERDFESHPMGECRNAARASTLLSQETAFLSMYIMGLADMKNRSNSSKQRQFHGNALPRARGLYRLARTAFLRFNCRF